MTYGVIMNIRCACCAAIFYAMAACSPSQSLCRGILEISGIQDDQVFQRNRQDRSDFSIAGQIAQNTNGTLELRILRRQQVVSGYDWQTVATEDDGRWTMKIDALQVGGPYRFEFRLQSDDGALLDFMNICGILVGDLWVMGGQSNMVGSGMMTDAETPSEMVHTFSLADRWQVAEDPIHYPYEAVYPIHRTGYISPTARSTIDYKPRGPWPHWPPSDSQWVGLGLSFAKTVYEKMRVPIGLIPCALGGTTMSQWDPGLKDKGGHSLYGAMMDRIDKVGGKIKGILWWQGESDIGMADQYEHRMRNFVSAVRKDTDAPNLPFYLVQLSNRGLSGLDDRDSLGWNTIQDIQRRISEDIPHSGVVSSIDASVTSAHLTAESYHRVGRRLAKLAMTGVYGAEDLKTGPSLDRIERFDSLYGDGLRIVFKHVNGQLTAEPRISGFSIRRKDGTSKGLYLMRAECDSAEPNAILLHLSFRLASKSEPLYLWYGWGSHPFCNVTDQEDMALPVFGPIPISEID